MSDFVLRSPSSHHRNLRSVIDWLTQARVAARLRRPSAPSPQASFLCDVGLTEEQIGRAVERGSLEVGLLSLGWQPPNRTARR